MVQAPFSYVALTRIAGACQCQAYHSKYCCHLCTTRNTDNVPQYW